MQVPNSQPDADDDNPLVKEKNDDDLKEERNPLIVSPTQSDKVIIIVKSPMLKDLETIFILFIGKTVALVDISRCCSISSDDGRGM